MVYCWLKARLKKSYYLSEEMVMFYIFIIKISMIYVDFSSCVKIWNKEKKYEFPYENEIIITLFIDLNTLNLSYI